MDPQSTLQQLGSINFKEKKILPALKKCIKKLSFKSSADLSNLLDLAMWLYVYGYDNHALKATQIIDELEFKGDFNIWTPVEKILLLQARIYREQGKKSKVQKSIDKVLGPMIPHEEAFKRRLSFNWLNDKGIERYLKENNVKTANEMRFADLGDLFFIRELGEGKTDIDGKKVDIAKAEERIMEYKSILKQVK
ncbi:MAG: hypothetical protein IPP66_05765 [Anaerolineales bacterium]|nr:hypothetical protein [Anaerolineales bacterium]